MAQKVDLEIKIATILGRKIFLVREQIFPLMVVFSAISCQKLCKEK